MERETGGFTVWRSIKNFRPCPYFSCHSMFPYYFIRHGSDFFVGWRLRGGMSRIFRASFPAEVS